MFGTRSRGRVVPAATLVVAGAAVASLTAAGVRRRVRRGSSAGDAADVVRRLLEEPWRGNPDAIEQLVAPGYAGHDPAEPDPVHGREALRACVERYLAAFPDARVTVEEQVVEGGRVVSRWTARGTQTGEIAGIQATGKEATVSGVTFSRVEAGKVVEQWTSWDRLGMLIQLGAVPAATTA